MSLLNEGYRTIAPDLPGFGQSPEPDAVWDVGNYADLISEFIESFGVKKVILLGHSFGGRIIIKLGSREILPFKIERAVLVDSAGIMPRRTAAYKIKVGAYKAAKKIFPALAASMRKRSGSADYAAASPVMRGCLVKAVNEDLKPLLPALSFEVLLIWGENDDATPLSDGETMEKLIPNAGLAKIPGAGHYSWLDRPDVFNAVIKSYFKL